FLFALITGNDNRQLRKFGDSLSIFIFDTLQFLIYNSEEKPFPFADWPESKVDSSSVDDGEDSSFEDIVLAIKSITMSESKAKKPAGKRKATPKPVDDEKDKTE